MGRERLVWLLSGAEDRGEKGTLRRSGLPEHRGKLRSSEHRGKLRSWPALQRGEENTGPSWGCSGALLSSCVHSSERISYTPSPWEAMLGSRSADLNQSPGPRGSMSL